MKLIITVNFDPGDVPDVRQRTCDVKGKIGGLIPPLIREQLENNLDLMWPELHGFDPATFRAAKIGRITTRLER